MGRALTPLANTVAVTGKKPFEEEEPDGGVFGGGGASISRKDGGEWVVTSSKFHFVDLAGSERVSRKLFVLVSHVECTSCVEN